MGVGMDILWQIIVSLANIQGAWSFLGAIPRWILRVRRGWVTMFLIPDRVALETKYHSTYETFSDTRQRTYGYWLSARGVSGAVKGIRDVNIRAVIFPDPEKSEWIANTESSLSLDYDLANQIKEATRILQGAGTEIYWHGRTPFTGTALTFGNPREKGGWANLDPIWMRIRREVEGPLFRVVKRGNEDEYATFWEIWKKLRDESREAPPMTPSD